MEEDVRQTTTKTKRLLANSQGHNVAENRKYDKPTIQTMHKLYRNYPSARVYIQEIKKGVGKT